MNYRKLPNGDLFVPRRGNNPPECPEGYYRDSGDQWIFHPCLNPCQHRTERIDKHCKCGNKIALWCTRFDRQIKLGECKECQDGLQA
jgi:hypothetical protein